MLCLFPLFPLHPHHGHREQEDMIMIIMRTGGLWGDFPTTAGPKESVSTDAADPEVW